MKRNNVKFVSFLLIFSMIFSLGGISVGAEEKWNSGAKINFVPATYENQYEVPDWICGNLDDLGIKAYEDLYANNSKWNIFVGPLRAYQNYLKVNNMQALTSNGASISGFKDSETLEPYVARSEAEILTRLGVLEGVEEENGTYMYMKNHVKRGEVAKILAVFYQKLFPEIQSIRGSNQFKDIHNHWAEKYIDYCYEKGLIDGKSDYSFDPDGYVTKAESIRLLCNMVNSETPLLTQNIAKAINETYKCTTAYDEDNSNSNLTQTQSSLIIPDKRYYSVYPNNIVSIEVKSSNSNRNLSFKALNGNIGIVNTTSKSGKYTINVRGIYEGTGIIECKLSSGSSSYNTLYIPIFVKGYNSTKASNINVSNTSIALNIGEQYYLSNDVNITPTSARYNGIYFSSTNPDIASVDYLTGQITARGTGSCYIYVMTYNMSKKISVKVSSYSYGNNQYYPNQNYNNLNFTINVGGTINLKSYNLTTGYNVSYYSTNTSVATVTSNGIVTGKRTGSAQIIVKDNYNKQTTVNLYVQGSNYNYGYDYDYDVERVTFINNYLYLDLDDECDMFENMYLYPSNADYSSLRFSSEDTSIAKVDRKEGIITGIGKGITRIKVYNNNFSAYCTVNVGYQNNVNNNVTNIEVNLPNNQLSINKDSSYYLANDISVYPSNVTNYKLYYSSNNTNVVKIDSNGKITAYNVGNATITITVGNISRKVYVTVVDDQTPSTTPPTTLPTQPPTNSNTTIKFLNKDTVLLGIGLDFNPYSILNVTSGVNFTLSDYSKAKIENGRVIGVAKGTVTLTASYNGSNDYITIIITD